MMCETKREAAVTCWGVVKSELFPFVKYKFLVGSFLEELLCCVMLGV